MKVALAGGTPVAVAEMQGGPDEHGCRREQCHWTTRQNVPIGNVMKAARETGAVTMLATGLTGGGAMALDATAVYWATSGEPFALIPRAARGRRGAVRDGGGTSVVARERRPEPLLANYDPHPVEGGSSIMKVAVGGGVATKLWPPRAGAWSWMVDALLDLRVGASAACPSRVARVTAILDGRSAAQSRRGSDHVYWTTPRAGDGAGEAVGGGPSP